MNISISKELAQRIEHKIISGNYSSADEVLGKALELLDEHDYELEGIRAFVQEGIDALDDGDYVEYTDDNLQDLVEDVHRRGLERLQNSQ
jgi:putative addiction module CopG family antidote